LTQVLLRLKIERNHGNLATDKMPSENPATKSESMVILIRGGNVFAPSSLGKKDILIMGSKIVAVSDPGEIQISGLPVLEEDASNKMVIPGFILMWG